MDSIARIAAGVRARTIDPVDVVNNTLERLAASEPKIGAWVYVDAEEALDAARRIGAQVARGIDPGPLAGVPIGVKDIFDVAGMPTGRGIDRPAPPAARDATTIARLRAAGAIILGKTTTTAFAWSDPTRTRNPRHPGRTPGGSSAGSGATVADGVVLAALGSQTGGSTLRPAAYNGCVGVKPAFGTLSRAGVVPLAPSLDHPGILSASVEDAALLLDAMSGPDPLDPTTRRPPTAAYRAIGGSLTSRAIGGSPASRPAGSAMSASSSAGEGSGRPPRLGIWIEAMTRADDPTRAAVHEAIRSLTAAGATTVEVSLPLDLILAVHHVVFFVEGAAVHRDLTDPIDGLMLPRLQTNVRVGNLIPGSAYMRASRVRRRLRALAADALRGLDALILPTVVSTAPTPETTGDFSLQAPGSLLGLPAVSLPCGTDADGLPFGLQVMGQEDETTLRVAAFAERVLSRL